MRNIIIITLVALFAIPSIAQTTSRDIKQKTQEGAELILDGKFDEAVGVFTEVLKTDPTQGKALLLRARAKYELRAFKGTLNDCFAYMERYGIDGEVAGLLGKAEMGMENYKKALSYLKVALYFEPNGIEYLLDRASILYDLGLDDQACEDWGHAAELGSDVANSKLKRFCKRIRKPQKEKPSNDLPSRKDPEVEPTPAPRPENPKSDVPLDDSTDQENDNSNNGSQDSGNGNGDDVIILEDDDSFEDEYPIDYTEASVKIDDELSLIIGGGIGSREVKEIPDMLILSDRSGEVVVDICANRIGEITSSSLNEELSTIKTKGLVSLALRKSEEFWFERSDRKEQCGTITFVITADED